MTKTEVLRLIVEICDKASAYDRQSQYTTLSGSERALVAIYRAASNVLVEHMRTLGREQESQP